MAHLVDIPVSTEVVRLRRRGVQITAVAPGSLAAEAGLEVGDRILKVGENRLRDVLDWRFHAGGETDVELLVEKHDGEVWELEVELDEGEDWGIEFEGIYPRQCANDCIFCFIKQNPAGARAPLFIKDEDIRLSFLHGNYTTMTSLTETEFQRIVTQRLSPQYVSVHATEPELRRYMLGRSRADDIMTTLRRLIAERIDIHAQVVLCPYINDGEALLRTVDDLAGLHPGLVSVAVVPLGMSKLHAERDKLRPVTDEWCRRVIEQMKPVQRALRQRLNTTFAFLGDEFYLRAGVRVPGPVHYGEYPQIEDGVGMVRRFETLMAKARRRGRAVPRALRSGTLATGRLFAPVLERALATLNGQLEGAFTVLPVRNGFFGEEITVAGLLTGRDVLAAAADVKGDFLVVPADALRSHDRVFLDGLHPDDVARELGRPVLDSDEFLKRAGLTETVLPLHRETYPHVPFL